MSAAIACLGPSVARAQDAAGGDVAVGYSFLRFNEGEGVNVPYGWVVSGSRRVAPLVSIVGQASGHYRVEDGEWLLLHSAMAGVRVAPSHTRVRPFVEILGGVASASCCGSETRFALEPGGGVDLPLGDRSAVRLGVSLPLVFADGDTTDLVRVQVAGVFRLGH